MQYLNVCCWNGRFRSLTIYDKTPKLGQLFFVWADKASTSNENSCSSPIPHTTTKASYWVREYIFSLHANNVAAWTTIPSWCDSTPCALILIWLITCWNITGKPLDFFLNNANGKAIAADPLICSFSGIHRYAHLWSVLEKYFDCHSFSGKVTVFSVVRLLR